MTKKSKPFGNEKEIIVSGLRKNGRNAYDRTLANGISVTVLRGNKICMVEPNGNISVISEVAQSKFKVARQVYSLKWNSPETMFTLTGNDYVAIPCDI